MTTRAVAGALLGCAAALFLLSLAIARWPDAVLLLALASLLPLAVALDAPPRRPR
jgi:hypothetical protein